MKRLFQNQLVLAMFLISSVIVLSLCIYTGNTLYLISKYAYKDTEERLLSLSRYAARIVTASELGELNTADDLDKPIFETLRRRLESFAYENDILYVYYMRNNADGMAQYIIDNDFTDGTVNLSSPPFKWEDKAKSAMDKGTAEAEMEIYLIGYDHLISAFAPVFDAGGQVVAIAGVDIDDQQILAVRKTMNILVPLLSAGVLLAMVCGLINVLLHRRTDKALKLALENALTASHAKSDFLANMSHEIRTPMNAIIGMVSIAESTDSGVRKDYAIGKIKDASAHLLGIINDILDMSKIEANKLELSPVEFNCEEMLQKVVNIISFKTAEKHQDFTVFIDNAIPTRLVSDDQRLAQVIANLLSNAVKFTPESGAISMNMRLLKDEGSACVIQTEVSDTGVGISKEQQTRLFASFVQAESSTTRKYGGTGLGLAISKRIVEMMGGKIWVTSEPGKGSVFGFTIKADKPAAAAAPGAATTAGAAAAAPAPGAAPAGGAAATTPGAAAATASPPLLKGGWRKEDLCARGDLYAGAAAAPAPAGGTAAAGSAAAATASPPLLKGGWRKEDLCARGDLYAGAAAAADSPPLLKGGWRKEDLCARGDSNAAASDGAAPATAGIAGEKAFVLNPMHKDIKVLFVDDNADILKYCADTLDHFGIACDTAQGGVEALRLIEAGRKYDVCFIDWSMPDMDGIELTRRLQGLDVKKNIILMISSIEWNSVEADAREAGACGYLPKPIFPSSIYNSVIKCTAGNTDAETHKNAAENVEHFEDYRVLLVEDVEINREIVMALLEPTKLKIDCAENGREALRLFTDNMTSYDMIFMDLQMPEMDGFETTRAIRALDFDKARHIPIVAMTANVFTEDIDKCMDAGMNDHIGKPLDIEELLTKLQLYLTKPWEGDNRRKSDRRHLSSDRRVGERRRQPDRRTN